MQNLFTTLSMGSMVLRNRLVRSATGERAADLSTGFPTAAMAGFYGRQAGGGVGLIITGHTAVSPEGRCHAGMTALTSPAAVPAFRALVTAAHDGGAALVCQLNHGGRQVNAEANGLPSVGPSLEIFPEARSRPQEALDEAGIRRLVEAFAVAAARCREAGFDGVQVHAAHGYLISQFNSPLTNRRQDAWGGTAERRRAFLLAVVAAVRQAVGADYPILVKQNVHDAHPEGLQVEDAIAICRDLDAAGVAAIELSGGIAETIPQAFRAAELRERGEAVFFAEECRRLRPQVGCALVLTGGIRRRATAEALLAEGLCDAIGLCRPLIREPDLPARWHAGLVEAARCTSCGGCRSTPEQCNVCSLDA